MPDIVSNGVPSSAARDFDWGEIWRGRALAISERAALNRRSAVRSVQSPNPFLCAFPQFLEVQSTARGGNGAADQQRQR